VGAKAKSARAEDEGPEI